MGETVEVAQAVTFSLGKVFTFLFLTLGPLKLIAPFAKATRGLDGAVKRRLAFQSTLVAAIALAVAPTLGAILLRNWGVSVGALLLTAGVVLFLVALRTVLEQYEPREAGPDSPPGGPPPSPMAIAFPSIVAPYGVAVLLVLLTLHAPGGNTAPILGVAGGVLLLDLLAMLGADRILRTPVLPAFLAIVGSVMAVLQVALGVQAMVMAVGLLRGG
jgi:multiple antibiotic resistance protein